MAKTIKFNLICDNKPIRTIDDLQNNFLIEDVMEYYDNGLLDRWLEVRGYESELEKVRAITTDEVMEVAKQLIKIFNITIEDKKIEESIYILSFLKEREDIAIIATGTAVYESQRAARLLQKAGISSTVVDMNTIKPLDTKLLDQLFTNHKLIVTVEEHSIIGGLGSAVAEYKTSIAHAPKQIMIGLPDTFVKAGEYAYLLKSYGLSAPDIAEKIKESMA